MFNPSFMLSYWNEDGKRWVSVGKQKMMMSLVTTGPRHRSGKVRVKIGYDSVSLVAA